MAKPFLCRLGIAQISANPAYADQQVATIQEPAFRDDDDKIGLFTVAAIEAINRLRQNIADQYVEHLNRKLEAVIRFAAQARVELLMFPEYSIPAEALPFCRRLSDELGIAIVAGSHVVTLSSSAQQAYRELGLGTVESSACLTDKLGHSVCVALLPGTSPLLFSKYAKSKWESSLVAGDTAFHSFEMTTRSGKIEVQVLICIEALAEKPLPKEKHSHPRVVVVPAFSPTTDAFYDEGRSFLRQGKCTLFANIAEFGGSRAFVRADKVNLWFTLNDGTLPMPAHAECLLVVEADLEKQFEVRKLVAEHTAVTDVKVYPLLYPFGSAEAQQYVATADELSSLSLAQMAERLEPFCTLTQKVFPRLLQDKIEHFRSHVVPSGTAAAGKAGEWFQAVVVSDTPSTDVVRWELCNEAIQAVNEALMSGQHVARSKELVDVLRHLINKRDALTSFIDPPRDTRPALPHPTQQNRRTTPTDLPFFNREQVFDRIRSFMNQHQTAAFVLTGMRGIGKSSLVEEAFRQAIPPKKKIWLQLTEGMSYERLLAQVGFACNIRMPQDLDLSNPDQASSLEQRIVAYLSQGPGAVVVLDDAQYLLTSGEIENPVARSFLLKLFEGPERSKSRFVLISNVATRFSPELEACCSSYTLRGLRNEDAVRLLQYWYQFRTGEASGQLPFPSDRFLNVLGGHPLATKVAARLCAEHPVKEIIEDISIFKELRDTIVAFILEQILLSGPESELLGFASVFRLPVGREAFISWKGEQANFLLNSVASQYLIETSERGYQLHPLVRDYYYSALTANQAIEYHRIAARLYLSLFERAKKADSLIVPEYLGEAVHHYLAAGDRHRVQDLAFYKQELRPVAVTHYRRGDFKLALKDYRVLVDLDDRDADAHLHLALIYARERKWPDAERHFGKAIEVRPKAHWILQAYGAAKLRAGKIAEAEQLLNEAEEANPYHAPTLVDLGRLHEKKGDTATAEEYFRGALQLDHENSFACYQLAGLLYRENQIEEAYEMAQMALSTKPTDERNKQLVKELKQKLQQSESTKSEAAGK